MNEYHAVLVQVEDGWIGWFEEIPGLRCQDETKEGLVDSMLITLEDALRFENLPTSNGTTHSKAA